MKSIFNLKNLGILILLTLAINISNRVFGKYPVYWIIIGIIVLVIIVKMVFDFIKIKKSSF